MKVLKQLNALSAKGTFHAGSIYVNHAMLCSTYKIKCETCEILFEERSDFLKHMTKFHSEPETVTRRGTNSMPAVISDNSNEKRQAGSQEQDYNDVGEDLEIEVCEMGMDIVKG